MTYSIIHNMANGGGMQVYNMLEWNIHMHTYLNHTILDNTFPFQNLWPVFLSTENAYIKYVAKHKLFETLMQSSSTSHSAMSWSN